MLPSKLAFLDIETTGANLTSDRIIDIGILRVEDNRLVQSFSTLIDPGDYIPPEITRLTGITSEQVQSAPTFGQLKDEILELVKDCVVVAHNAQFDCSFLKAEFRRAGKRFSPKRLCTVKLSRKLYPRQKRHNLDTIMERHGIFCDDRHRGIGDAKVIWDFYKLVLESHKEERILKAIGQILAKPTLPPNISREMVAALPNSPGVYILYGSDGAALYVGKSNNIKKRVLQHFTNSGLSGTELKIAQQVQSIEAVKTAGELGALLRESDLVKKLQPLYNRVLRKVRQLVILKRVRVDGGYTTVLLEESTQISPQELNDILLIFKSKKQANAYLVDCAKNHKLCEKLLGLEKTKRQCFGYNLGRCMGACLGEEEIYKYNVRFEEAFVEKAVRPWPYSGAVLIEETDTETEKTEQILVNKWCLLNNSETNFNWDVYKILVRYFKDKKYRKNIHQVQLSDGQADSLDTAFSAV